VAELTNVNILFPMSSTRLALFGTTHLLKLEIICALYVYICEKVLGHFENRLDRVRFYVLKIPRVFQSFISTKFLRGSFISANYFLDLRADGSIFFEKNQIILRCTKINYFD